MICQKSEQRSRPACAGMGLRDPSLRCGGDVHVGIGAPVNVGLCAADVADSLAGAVGFESWGGSGLPSGQSSTGGCDMGFRVLGSV